MTADLHSLRERPFELLAALDARLRASGEERGLGGAGAQEWTGLAFELDGAQYLAPQDDVREVLELPAMTRVPGAKPWLLGIANVRGYLLPLVDLGRLLGREESRFTADTRVLVFDDDAIPAGFVVDGVSGFRGFAPTDQRHEMVDKTAAVAPFLLGAFVRDGGLWQVFSLRKLAHDPIFRDASL